VELAEFCHRMRQEVAGYSSAGRQDTAAFLIWFLINYFRIEPQDAIDSVCDHTNDKGIDGIWIDDEEERLYLFQSKFSPVDDNDQGDNDIRNLEGASAWFEDEATVQQLLDSTVSHELKSLINNQEILEKAHFDVISVFVTNKRFNIHANEYLEANQNIEGYDSDKLFQEYTYFSDEEITTPPINLRLDNPSHIDYPVQGGLNSRVYAIKAKELVRLEGIQDRTLFLKNVRYGVGNTRVNKSIKSTILNSNEHAKFFLYHNGITIICGSLSNPNDHTLTIGDYAVVNGCQSMLSFYEHRDKLSNRLFVLTKIINLNVDSPMVRDITYYANNQNSIGLADLRSNDSVQRSLQRQFQELFGDEIGYLKKRGEETGTLQDTIDKDYAAQLIESVYYGNPQNTHLKQKLFGEEYTKIFSRRINAEKIYLSHMLYEIVVSNVARFNNEQIRSYGLARFYFAHALAEVIRYEELGQTIIETPREYVTTHKTKLRNSLTKLWQFLIPDINADINEYTAANDGFFDYKNVFKNSAFVDHMDRRIKVDYERLIMRNPDDSFTHIYQSME